MSEKETPRYDCRGFQWQNINKSLVLIAFV
jgi:hypothetical protein